jgi:hypothetical protein
VAALGLACRPATVSDVATATQQVAQDITTAAARFAASVDRDTVSVFEARCAAREFVARLTGATCPEVNDRPVQSGLTGVCLDLVEVEAVTETFFIRASCDKRKVNSLDDLGSFLADRASQSRLLLTNDTIVSLARRVLGGDVIVEQFSTREIRAAAARHCSDPTVVGCVELDTFFDTEGICVEHLVAANTVVASLDRFIAQVVDVAVEEHEPSLFRQERRQLAAAVGFDGRSMPPLVLPRRATLVNQVANLVPLVANREMFETFQLALDAKSEHDRQEYRGRNGMSLCREVYRLVWERGRYVSLQMDNIDNVYHLECRFAGADRPLDRVVVQEVCSQVPGTVARLLCRVDCLKGSAVEFRAMPEVARYVTSLAQHGRLPHKSQLPLEVVDAIEAFARVTYREVACQVAAEHGFLLPMSSNESVCLDLLTAALADMGGASEVAYDRVPNLNVWAGSQLRPDFLVSFDTPGCLPGLASRETVVVEADGEGHFEQVRGWSLEDARRRDTQKAALVFDAAASGERVSLLAFHHAALRRVDAGMMRSMLETMSLNGWTWVFVVPSGCDDRRAVDAVCRQVPVVGFDGFDVFVAERPVM